MPLAAPVRAEDVVVPLRDGTSLAADLVRPDDDEAHPVLLVRTPYSRQSLREYYDPIRWARDGWAVVFQDVRGRFDSAGDFSPFHQEVDDGADSVAWCAAQPWSSGQVAMAGASYNGATQWLAALTSPPALAAIAPAVSTADIRDGFFYTDGAIDGSFPASWAIMLAGTAPKVTKTTLKRAVKLVNNWDHVLGTDDGRSDVAALFPDFARWHDPEDAAYWRPIDVSRAYRKLDVAGWHLAGWYDIFCEGSLAAYAGMTAHAATPRARASQRLVVGPWTHAALYAPGTAEVDFGLKANGLAQGLPEEMRAFLRDSIEGRPVKAGVSVFVMGRNDWRELPSWPPPATATPLFLADGGGLAWEAPAARARSSWTHDPADPVPNRGGRTLSPVLPMAGPMDQRPVESRDDVLVFTSAPLRKSLTVIGTITATLTVTSSAAVCDVTVKVCDVHPDGRSINVVDGVRRQSFTPGRARTVSVRVGSTAMEFTKGHRIRVHVAASNFPKFGLLPAAELTLSVGGSNPSALTLPVLP